MANFKKGDKVKVIEGKRKGEIVLVDQDNSRTPYIADLNGQRIGAEMESHLELVEDQPFKVGDRVRRINYASGNFKVGDIGTVIDREGMFKNWVYVNIDGKGISDGSYNPKNLEKVEEPTLTIDNDFKLEVIDWYNTPINHSLSKMYADWAKTLDYSVYSLYRTGAITTTKPKNIMTTVSNFAKKLLDKKTQALIKAGYMNDCLELTSKGREALELIAFETHKDALVEAAEADIKEAEAKK